MELLPGFKELYTHEALQNAGLALNARLRLIVCIKCQVALPKTRVKKHGEKHEWSTDTEIAVVSFLKENGAEIDSKYPSSTFPEPVQPFEGLPIVNNYHGCPHCAYAAQAKGIKVHIKSCASANATGVKKDGMPKANISAQTYSVQNNQSWFQVVCTDDTPSSSVRTQDNPLLISQMPQMGTTMHESESVRVCSYLMAIRTLNTLKNRPTTPPWMWMSRVPAERTTRTLSW